MSDNIYFGYAINDNLYYKNWMHIFKKKETDNIDLLISIVESDRDETYSREDSSIGHQAIANIILRNQVFVTRENIDKVITAISLNLVENENWLEGSLEILQHGYSKDWIAKRFKELALLISNLTNYNGIVEKEYYFSKDLRDIISKRMLNRDRKEEVLNEIFFEIIKIAKEIYNVHPAVDMPKEIVDKINSVISYLRVFERTNSEVGVSINMLGEIISRKKWLF